MSALAVEWGAAHRPIETDSDSGERYVVRPFPEGILIAVLDGLGHGREAAGAVALAAGALESHAGESPSDLLVRCHAALRRTRGAALSVASINFLKSTLTWLGVGNVEGVLLRANRSASRRSESLLLRGGVVGHQLPPPGAAVLPVAVDDTLIFATDGVAHGFSSGMPVRATPEATAKWILTRHGKRTDDALVVVARCVASPT